MAWVVALTVFASVRFDLSDTPVRPAGVVIACAFVVTAHIGLGWIVRLHQGRAQVGSFEDSVLLGGVVTTAGASLTLVNALLPEQWVPRTVPIAATCLALVLQAWGRAAWRRVRERDSESHDRTRAVPTLVVGAGDAGRELLHSMLRDPAGRYRAIGFLDDDPR